MSLFGFLQWRERKSSPTQKVGSVLAKDKVNNDSRHDFNCRPIELGKGACRALRRVRDLVFVVPMSRYDVTRQQLLSNGSVRPDPLGEVAL